VVTAKLPERDGAFEYHIRSANEEYERIARENELSAITVEDKSGDERGVKLKAKPKSKAKRP
jgi:hypothetical protein